MFNLLSKFFWEEVTCAMNVTTQYVIMMEVLPVVRGDSNEQEDSKQAFVLVICIGLTYYF